MVLSQGQSKTQRGPYLLVVLVVLICYRHVEEIGLNEWINETLNTNAVSHLKVNNVFNR